mmetsp:Transcript_16351/g.38429  ORF Transcript_16351/g.38429 Transcript_16351/m.38429 type:complete len:257 (-) Transcript_16351:941-1711(-)
MTWSCVWQSFVGKRNEWSQMSGIIGGDRALVKTRNFNKSLFSNVPAVQMMIIAGGCVLGSQCRCSSGSGIFSGASVNSGTRSILRMKAVAAASMLVVSKMDTQWCASSFCADNLSTVDSACVVDVDESTDKYLSFELALEGALVASNLLTNVMRVLWFTAFGTSMRTCCEIQDRVAAMMSRVMPLSVNTCRSVIRSSSSMMNPSSGSTELGRSTPHVGTFFSLATHISPTHHGREKISFVHTTTNMPVSLATYSNK